MKKLVLSAFGLMTSCVMLAQYNSILFSLTSGENKIISAEELEIIFTDDNLVATSGEKSLTIPLINIDSMEFSMLEPSDGKEDEGNKDNNGEDNKNEENDPPVNNPDNDKDHNNGDDTDNDKTPGGDIDNPGDDDINPNPGDGDQNDKDDPNGGQDNPGEKPDPEPGQDNPGIDNPGNEDDPTGDKDDPAIGDDAYVQSVNADNQRVEIFNLNGTHLGRYESIGDAVNKLDQGIYLIKSNGKTMKIVVRK